jgi:hypothetical protein
MIMSTFIGFLKAQGKRDDQVGELARWWTQHGDSSRSVAGVQKRVFEASDGRDMPLAFAAAAAEYETSRTPGGTAPAPVAVPDIPGWAEPSEGVAWGGGGPGAAERLAADRAPHPVTAAVRDATQAGLAAAQAHERSVDDDLRDITAGETLDRLKRIEDLLAVIAAAVLALDGLPDGEPDHAALWAAADFSG